MPELCSGNMQRLCRTHWQTSKHGLIAHQLSSKFSSFSCIVSPVENRKCHFLCFIYSRHVCLFPAMISREVSQNAVSAYCIYNNGCKIFNISRKFTLNWYFVHIEYINILMEQNRCLDCVANGTLEFVVYTIWEII